MEAICSGGKLKKAEIIDALGPILDRVAKLIRVRNIENLAAGKDEDDNEDDILEGLFLIETRLLSLAACPRLLVSESDVAALHAAGQCAQDRK